MWNNIVEFFNNNLWIQMLVEGYLIFCIVSFIVYLIAYSKRAFYLVMSEIIFIVLFILTKNLNLEFTANILKAVCLVEPIFIICVLAPDFRNIINFKQDIKEKKVITGDNAKNEIADAVMYLSSKKIGALITIENNNSLDQYAERAISLNSDISKELLINIFIPNTPLHDGAVIIRGNKIRCAAAYYTLTNNEDIDKTTGSRHRAALGISGLTDSLTIIVSEETGRVSLAMANNLIRLQNKEDILYYLDSNISIRK